MSAPLVYVIVLNYNGARWLPDCFAALRATTYANVRFLLVDNGSQDDSVARVREQFPQVEIIENGANLGFPAGNNVGMRHALAAGAAYLVLLNPDTKVQPDWLTELVNVGEREPGVGILGAVQYGYDDTEFNSWTRTALAARLDELRQAAPAGTWWPVEWVEGSCFAIKRAVAEHIGLLDPLYFSFYEEIDYCRRAACAGFQTALVVNSRFHHFRGGSWQAAAKQSRRRNYLCDRGQFIYTLTDPRRSWLANLRWGWLTLATKVKEAVVSWDAGRLLTLLQIQLFLLTHSSAVYGKWKREQLLSK